MIDEERDVRQLIENAVANEIASRIAQVEISIRSEIGRMAFATPSRIPNRVYEVQHEFPWMPELTFGLERTAADKIKILNCKLRRFGDPQGTAPNQTIWYTCADKEVTFTGDGDGQRICWKWNPTDGLRILDNAQTNDPIDDSTDIYGVVAIFNVTNSRAELATGGIIQCGQPITLPVFTKPGT